MKERKGFTLVELLAVIVILAIIMIIAIPSVLNTMETASRKTLLEYYQKVLNATEKKFIEDSNFGNLPSNPGEAVYCYDIKRDLGFSSTGNFYGMVGVFERSNKKITYTVILADDNHVIYWDTGDGDLPDDALYDIDEINQMISTQTGGAVKEFKDLTMQLHVDMSVHNTKCARNRYYYDAKTGDPLGFAPYIEKNWETGTCKETSGEDLFNS